MTTPRQLDGSALLLGVATASFQIEGAATADGRGPSIWDTFCARPGAIVDGSNGDVACGSYERTEEDLDLVRDLGVDIYRFSVAWPRVQPTGSGAVNIAGLDYYDRVVDGCLARGLRPLPTLYHWDLPQPLEDAGGWPARDTAHRFADYAAVVADRLGDRVAWWATLNEPWCSAFLGYAAGVHAPGRREPDAAFAAAHHLLLGHALGAQAIHAAAPDAQVGIVLNLAPVWPEDDDAAEAVEHVDAIQNGIWLGALVDGAYPKVLPALQDDALVQGGDLAAVAGSAAWIGINYYTPFRIATGAGGSERVQSPHAYPGGPVLRFEPRAPMTEMGWEVEPRGLTEVLVTTWEKARLPLMVTENGAAYADATRTADGAVDDEDRAAYLRDHLAATRAAQVAGADVRAYIAWTLLDNFEWAEGYTKKFGIVEVEPGTLRRIPKRSYRYYAGVAADTAVG